MNSFEIVNGFKQYSELVDCLPEKARVVDLFIGGKAAYRNDEGDWIPKTLFETTSADVLNQTIDDCSQFIHPEQGLLKLHMSYLADQNHLTYWPFSQLVSKAPHLNTLIIEFMQSTTAENRSTLMNFCREICQTTDSLQTLHFELTCSSDEDGCQFWSALANDDDCLKATLQNLTVKDEFEWFIG